MVERSFDRDEYRPDPAERRREAERRQRREAAEDRERQRSQQREDAIRKLMEVVNDERIEVDAEMVKAINDPSMVMTENGDVAKITQRRSGLGGQFADQFFALREIPLSSKKPRRKNRKNAKALSMALKEANAKLRKKNGALRKGKTQRDVMKLAHRILKRNGK